MATHSNIEWTDATWNPVVGCSIISSGCINCYAMKQAARLLDGNPKSPHYAGTTDKVKGNAIWTGHAALAPEHILTQPLRWRKPRRIFVNSMGDLFHENVPDEWIDKAFAVMAICPQHTFQVLTKRPERMREYIQRWKPAKSGHPHDPQDHYPYFTRDGLDANKRPRGERLYHTWPLPNVWLGVSAENQATADERIPILLITPAAKRFVSAEPLLGPINLNRIHEIFNGGLGQKWESCLSGKCFDPWSDGDSNCNRLDWVIVGGESGPNARPMHPEWVRSLRDQCLAAKVPFFFKQWGEWHPCEIIEPRVCCPMDGHKPFDCWKAPIFDTNIETGWNWRRIGKTRAGRTLDGCVWDEIPEDKS